MNSRDLFQSFNELDETLLERSEQRAARARNEADGAAPRVKLKRFLTAAAALILVFGASFGIAKAASDARLQSEIAAYKSAADAVVESEIAAYREALGKNAFLAETEVPEGAVLPIRQTGFKGETLHYVMGASPDKTRDLCEIFEESDAVCILTVRDWLGENEVTTWYEATVERTYKGELPEKIVLYQLGNSLGMCNDAPLYTYGDKLLVGIRRWESRPYENAYNVIGNDSTAAYVSLAKDGKAYVIDPEGQFSYCTRENHPELEFTQYGGRSPLAMELFEEMAKYDEAMAEKLGLWFGEYHEHPELYDENEPLIPTIYSLDEIEDFFEGLAAIND